MPKVCSFASSVEIECNCYYPKDRTDVPYTVRIYGHELIEGKFETTLDFYQARREDDFYDLD